MKILVIEDDPTVGQFVKRGFEEQRWGVDLVANGDDGEARAVSEEYDVIILDMRLPGKSGAQVLHDLPARAQIVKHLRPGFSRHAIAGKIRGAGASRFARARVRPPGVDSYRTGRRRFQGRDPA